jgi:hypothetical protein
LPDAALDIPNFLDIFEKVREASEVVGDPSRTWVLKMFDHVRNDKIIVFLLKLWLHFVTVLPD